MLKLCPQPATGLVCRISSIKVVIVAVLLFTLAACSRQMDVAVVLDMSGSNDQIFDVMFYFIRTLALGLPVGSGSTRVAVVAYSDLANASFHLNTYSTSQQVRNSSTNPAVLFADCFILKRGASAIPSVALTCWV